MEKPEKHTARPKFYYGWIVAFSLLVIYFLADGISLTVPPVLYPRLIKEFSASEGAVSFCGAITLMVAGIVAPFAGAFLDRLGPRRMIRIGLILLALCGLFYAQASSLWLLYALHALMGIGLVLCGMMSIVVLVSNWFVKRRATVLGLVLAGSSLSGGILPNLVAPVVGNPGFGWRWGYGLVLGLLIAIALPLSFLLVKERPSEMGLHPDGDIAPNADEVDVPLPAMGVPFREATAQSAFWEFAVSLAALWFSVFVFHSQLIIFVKQDLGFTQELAAFCFSLIFICSVTGNLLFSAVSDRLGRHRVIPFTALLLFFGSLLLLEPFGGAPGMALELTRSPWRLLAFSILFGSGYGGTFTILQAMISDTFGPRELGRILGALTFMGTAGGFAGISSSGFLRTWTGSYLIPFMTVSGMCGLMLILLFSLRRPTAKHDQAITD
jgi:MFS family permease